MTAEINARGAYPEKSGGSRLPEEGNGRGFFWWIGLIYKFLLVLLFIVTATLMVMVYLMLYKNDQDKIDIDKINKQNEDAEVATLMPSSVANQKQVDSYAFVPDKNDSKYSPMDNSVFTGSSQNSDKQMAPYIIGSIGTGDGSQKNSGYSDDIGSHEDFRPAPNSDPSFLGGMGEKHRSVPDPNGGNPTDYDDLF